MKKILTTPISDEDIKSLKTGDIVYLNGTLVTCRDEGHRRVVAEGIMPKLPMEGIAIFHAGPIVRDVEGGWEMVSIGPTTSMRMERYEKEFLAKTGVKLVIGKEGTALEDVSVTAFQRKETTPTSWAMGEKDTRLDDEYKALYSADNLKSHATGLS